MATPAQKLSPLVHRARAGLEKGLPFALMFVRASVGVMFAQAGWGKLQNLARTSGFFESLGIPAPGFHALLVGNVEFIGGILLALGLASRLSALPLAITMMVAILTAHLPDAEGIADVLALSETTYLAVLLVVVTQGPGKWSLDSLLSKKLRPKSKKEERSLS